MPDEYKDFDRQTCPFCHGDGGVCRNCGETGCSCEDEYAGEGDMCGEMECPECEGTGWVE